MNDFPTPLSLCSIVVLAHNREEQIRATLDNLKAETSNSGIEVIVVDNGSTDQTGLIIEEVLQGWFEAKVIRCECNVGVSEGRNIGWRIASGEFIVSIDDDILISRAMIEEFIDTALKIPGFGILSPTIFDSKTNLALNGQLRNETEASRFYEACFLIRKSILAQVGYMDKLLSRAGEGLDFSLRLRRANFPIIRASKVAVYHVDRLRNGGDNEMRRLAWMWSFARVYWKNYSPPLALLLTFRNYLAHLRTGLFEFGVGHGVLLTKELLSGSISGFHSRRLGQTW